MTLLAHEVREFLVDRILAMMREAAQREDDPTLGPPCSRFYLRQRQDVSLPPQFLLDRPKDGQDIGLAEFERAAEAEIIQRKARFDVARVIEVWEIVPGDAHELPAEEYANAGNGSLRAELYENAIVDFWTEAAVGLVHIDWMFGPKHGLGQTSRVHHRNGSVEL